jgi:N-acetylmuramoyl-L-alanine amidase
LDSALDRCGFDSKVGLSGTMYTRVPESNAFGADAHLPIHTNAFNKKVAGTRIMIAKRGGEAEELAKAIMDELGPITPGESDVISVNSGLYEVYATKGICVYIEVGFHDEPEEAQWLIDHGDEAAEAICRGCCKHYGVAYVAPGGESAPAVPEQADPEAPEEKPNTGDTLEKKVYRVQVGAFHNKEYAEALMENLKGKGYAAYVV